MINYLFWDFDGTVMDTYPAMVAAFKQALMDLGIDDVEIDEHDIYKIMRQHSVGAALDKFSAFYRLSHDSLAKLNGKYQTMNVTDSKPFAGVEGVLKFAVENGGKNFLLTHRDDQSKELLAESGLLEYFSDFVTSANDFPRKPKPDSLNYLIEKNNVSRNHAAMIGDRSLDIEAGHNANIEGYLFDPDRTIVTTGSTEYRTPSMTELRDYLITRK
ncbi:HAD-IA family hydrolase [Lentilactobacillus sp. Marseille-Q4993]|uniref:HAD-IA family hydrolase n=1 Tax=Lentilactobacillus sp. Marseille-Q4993 TaxID=3039492 RepID=UPI0024BCF400|nr:HAD-IA family hydrolase [Lentilactobacillus sp. Marseille-Q4993]